MQRIHSRALGVVLAIGLGSASAFAAAPAADYYLKLGPIKGESEERINNPVPRDGGKQIEIQAWSWGASNSGSAAAGGISAGKMQAGGGKAQGVMGTAVAADFDADGTDRKRVDKATPLIARAPASGRLTLRAELPACAVGTRYADAVVGNAQSRIELKDVVIASCAPGEVSLDYASVRALP
jgi:type VI protein secretion system component Hcp